MLPPKNWTKTAPSGSIAETIRNHKTQIRNLLLLSLAVKGAVLLFAPLVGFVDTFDLSNYGRAAFLMAQGQIPYLQFPIEYPPGFLLALAPPIALASLFPDAMGVLQALFVPAFVLEMVACDAVTLTAVYLIGLKIGEEHAYPAAFLYATAFSAAYFVLTKYDAFPVMLLTAGVALFLYREHSRGTLALVTGAFTKIFPAAAIPGLVVMEHRSWEPLAKWTAIGAAITAPFVWLNPFAFLFPVGGGSAVYASSSMALFDAVLHLPPLVYSAIAGVLLFCFVVYLIERGIREPRAYLAATTLILLVAIVFSPFHSPQYYLWFTPFLALLCVDVGWKRLVFYGSQAFFFLEFPVLFGRAYTNLEWTSPLAVVFFAAELGMLVFLGWMVAKEL